MRGCLGISVCVLALLWGGMAPVAHADGDYVEYEEYQYVEYAEHVEFVTFTSAHSDHALVEVAGALVTAEQTVEPDVPSLIVEAARRWGLDEHVLLRIAWCESRYDPQARGPAGLSGVFQFAPITWSWVAEKAGHPGASPFDAHANIEAAAWLYKTEGPKHWGCK